MIALIQELFSYTFIVRAVIVGILVSLCAALLGVNLVLKRYSMIGIGLSNVGFGALSLSLMFGFSTLQLSIPIVAIASILLLRLSENSKIKGDAAIALISSVSLAVGIIAITVKAGINTDVCNYMFGSILAMSKSDVYISIAVSIVVIVLYVLFYNKIFLVTFDENFARAVGINAEFYNMLISILASLIIVLGMRMMGAMLISSLIIFPALTSMRVFNTFKSVVISSAILSVLCFFIGIIASFQLEYPTGACIVMVNLAMLLIFSIVGRFIKLGAK